jgi:hypothetical protein
MLEGQYSGERRSLRPIYEALAGIAVRLGPDVRVAPRSSMVSLIRIR